MKSQPIKIVHSETERVLIENIGKEIVFYGLDKKDPMGRIKPGYCTQVPKNCIFWSAVGQANVKIFG